jgi:acetyl esterase/lipase
VDAADDLSCRPDFAVVVYPGYLALADKDAAGGYVFTPDIPVTKETPPTFLVQAEDDPVHVENAVLYFMELKKAGVEAELHVYARGGHGYGLRRTELPVTGWPDLVDTWMKTIGVVR